MYNPALLNDNESPRLENVSLDEKGTFIRQRQKERYVSPSLKRHKRLVLFINPMAHQDW